MKTQYAHTMVLTKIGLNVSRLRSERGMTQTTLACLATVDRSHLNQIENGKNNASVIFLAKIADCMGVPITAFFEGLETLPPCELFSEAKEGEEGTEGVDAEAAAETVAEAEAITEEAAESLAGVEYETFHVTESAD